MNLVQLHSLIENSTVDQLISNLEVHSISGKIKESIKQYEICNHNVVSGVKRPDKQIMDEKGQLEKTVPVSRLTIPEQKRIVKISSAFLGVPALHSNAKEGTEGNMVAVIEAIHDDNKMDYRFRTITKMTMSETECAELWYPVDATDDDLEGLDFSSKYTLKVRLLSHSLGDTLYPVFDEFDNMIAFARKYSVKEIDESSGAESDIDKLDIYTADRIYYMTKSSSGWDHIHQPNDKEEEGGKLVKVKGLPNPFKKIPVIYYSQPATEWSDVQSLIDRLEEKLSNHADTNDYFDSPIVKAKGDVKGFSGKGEQGKVLEMGESANVEYLTWDSLPESKKMEMENLLKFINQYTQTPDISLENLKGIGALSGIALKTFFMEAHLKAADKEEIFGMGVTRRINYLKNAVSILDSRLKAGKRVKITPVFTYFLPKDIEGEVNTIVKAYDAGILSLETALKLNPLVEDWENEKQKIEAEGSKQKPIGFNQNSSGQS